MRKEVTDKTDLSLFSGHIRVPQDYPTIQKALNAAEPGYAIEVFPGKYNEQLIMKEGILLISYAGEDGNELVSGPGHEPVLKRAKRTILDGDGFPWGTAARPMVTFPPGISSKTVLDGFTVTGMPLISTEIPNHPHVLECGGASPVIRNNIIYDNAAAAIGSYAVFGNHNKAIILQDYRFENVIHESIPLIHDNVIYENLFGGIHCKYYSKAVILRNEVFRNESRDSYPGVGIGVQYGSSPYIKKNLVYENDWSGIGCRKGKPMGKFPVNRPVLPRIIGNEVYANGQSKEKDHRAGIGLEGVGAEEKEVLVEDNLVYRNFASGISVRKDSVILIKNNTSQENENCGIGVKEGSGEIAGNTLENNTKVGIGILKGQYFVVRSNLVQNNWMSGIGMESVSNSVVRDNNIYNNGLSGFWEVIKEFFGLAVGGVGIRVQNCRKIKIAGNRIESNQRPGITVTKESLGIDLENNYINKNGLADNPNLSVIKGSEAYLYKNTLMNSQRSNLAIEESVAVVERNIIRNSYQPGIYLNKNRSVKVRGNRITNSGTHGISVSRSDGLIVNNTIRNSEQYGIVFGRRVKMVVKGNVVSGSGIADLAGVVEH
ncbi:MAG: right-handed parallel beta-helix repeat-containing protein [bacterium]